MKSRTQFRPNGTYLFKQPEAHFETSDIINAIDKWSKSIKNNPVPNFADKIEIKQANFFPLYLVKSIRKYENRSIETRSRLDDPNKYPAMPATSWKTVDAWNYNIKEQEESHEVILEDTIYSERCTRCNATGTINPPCTSCSGRGHTNEKVYSNGREYVEKVECSSCSGTGEKSEKCPNCKGYGGAVHFAVCKVYYNYPKHLKLYCDPIVANFLDDLNLKESDFKLFENVSTTKDFIDYVDGDMKRQATADIVQFVQSNDSNNQNFLRDVTQYGQTFTTLAHLKYEDGSEFTIAISGEHDSIHAPTSPVSNSVDQLLEDVSEFLQKHDLKNAKLAIAHIAETKTKMDILENIINKFAINISNALIKYSDKKENGEIKNALINRIALKISNLDKSNAGSTIPYKTELMTIYIIPLITSLGFNFWQFMKNPVQYEMVAYAMCSFFITSLYAGINLFFMRKFDIFYQSLKSYIVHSLIVVAPITAIASSPPNASSYIVMTIFGTIILAAEYFGVNALVQKNKILKISDEAEEKFNDILNVLTSYKLEDASKLLPGFEFKYISEELNQDYQAKSRILEDTLRETSEEIERNLISVQHHKKTA